MIKKLIRQLLCKHDRVLISKEPYIYQVLGRFGTSWWATSNKSVYKCNKCGSKKAQYNPPLEYADQ